MRDAKDKMRTGLIPAGAGKTPCPPSSSSPRKAHPRGGGENSMMRVRKGTDPGSSPRGRGKPRRGERPRGRSGLIPAGAGKTAPCPTKAWNSTAHPRGGGENDEAWAFDAESGGSSPRGRGKHERESRRLLRLGLIPAGAGKTQRSPAIRGGQTGSSPRGRGKPRADGHGHRRRGLIPAGAGKTIERTRINLLDTAHPRGGGENDPPGNPGPPFVGSSPRGRGKLALHKPDRGALRLIPAGAGKTKQ